VGLWEDKIAGVGQIAQVVVGYAVVLQYSAGAGTVDVFVADQEAKVQPACNSSLLAIRFMGLRLPCLLAFGLGPSFGAC
jgi:hypothetical protein